MRKIILKISHLKSGGYYLYDNYSLWSYFNESSGMRPSDPTYYPTEALAVAAAHSAGYEVEGHSRVTAPQAQEKTMNTNAIEGVPVGCKLVAIRRGLAGEWGIGRIHGLPIRLAYGSTSFLPIIAPDNRYDVVDLATVPIPDGYERDGDTPEEWFRELRERDLYRPSNSVNAWTHDRSGISGDRRRIILRKIAPKTKRVLVGEWEIDFDNRPTGANWISNPEKFVKHGGSIEGGAANFRIEEREI